MLRYKIRNTFLAESTKLETSLTPKVQDYKHLFCSKLPVFGGEVQD